MWKMRQMEIQVGNTDQGWMLGTMEQEEDVVGFLVFMQKIGEMEFEANSLNSEVLEKRVDLEVTDMQNIRCNAAVEVNLCVKYFAEVFSSA